MGGESSAMVRARVVVAREPECQQCGRGDSDEYGAHARSDGQILSNGSGRDVRVDRRPRRCRVAQRRELQTPAVLTALRVIRFGNYVVANPPETGCSATARRRGKPLQK